ncbi:MAG: DUF1295 domain-containing protein [Woeseiaceae bacterium]
MDWQLYTLAMIAILIGGVLAWLYSVIRTDVSIVDSLWSLFFLLAASIYAYMSQPLSIRGLGVFILVAVWSIRLSAYITIRNHGTAEDYRYQTIRANNEPNFWFKSLFIVFVLQGLLAWAISVPLLVAISSPAELTWLDGLALALFVVGLVFEAGGDYQLARFKADSNNSGKVMQSGLWRYTRHPNYFGDFCVWWAFFLFALAAGAWWTIVAPLLMSFLLLKVSGVVMLEKTIGDRRPEYTNYIEQTNAFFPGPRRSIATNERAKA